MISSGTLDYLSGLAAENPGQEVCGLLLGTGNRIEEIVVADNVADDPARHFEIDPAMQIRWEKGARGGGRQILGYYHSHPNGLPQPSVEDAASAAGDGRIWLILTENGITAWRAIANGRLHGWFDELELAVCGD